MSVLFYLISHHCSSVGHSEFWSKFISVGYFIITFLEELKTKLLFAFYPFYQRQI